ncbi:MAG: ATPase, T2SS/T4P/T4SS family [Actinomycetota bacterium]
MSDAAVLDDIVSEVHRTVATAEVVSSGASVGRAAEVRRHLTTRLPLASEATVATLLDAVLARLDGWGPLEPLLSLPGVTDVLVNGPGAVWLERDGRLVRSEVVVSGDDIAAVIQRAVAPLGLRVDRSAPTVDARLPGGARLHAVLPPLAVDGPYVSIRLPARVPVELSAFAPPEVVELLRGLVLQQRANVLVAGATGAGKTTLLSALLRAIDVAERVVILEEAAEIVAGDRHVVRLETRRPNSEGVGEATLAQLVRETLRMRPDRLVLGEVRGAEAFDLVQALATGHRGSLATIHAADAGDALRRLEALALMAGVAVPHAALRSQIGAALDLICVVERTPAGRRLGSVVRVARDGDPDAGRCLVHDGRLVEAGP